MLHARLLTVLVASSLIASAHAADWPDDADGCALHRRCAGAAFDRDRQDWARLPPGVRPLDGLSRADMAWAIRSDVFLTM